MACDAQINTVNSLMAEGQIDQAMNINNITQFEQVNEYIGDQADALYGVVGKPFTIEEKQRKAFAGHSYHRDNMITTYRAVPNTVFFEAVSDAMNSPEPIDFWEDDLLPASEEDGVQPRFERYIIYKQNLIKKLEQRLAIIESEKKRAADDSEYLKRLIRLETDIKNRLEGNEGLEITGLKQEVIELLADPQTSRFEFYAEKDFERLESLVQSDKAEDMEEADQIIHFYEALGTFSTDEIHPLYNEVKEVPQVDGTVKLVHYNTALDEDGETIIPQEIVDLFSGYKNRAIKAKNTIHHKKRQFLENVFNSDKRITNTFGDEKKFTFEEITAMSEGLKDTSWVDMFIMDVTNGIFSDNGMLPQVMMGLLKDAFESNLVRAKQFQVKIDNIQQDLNRVLSDESIVGEDYTINIPGVKNGVVYDLFRAKDELGNFKDTIIQRYDSSFYSERDRMFDQYKRAIDRARKIENAPQRRAAFAEAQAIKERWYRKNAVILDVTQIPEVAAAFPEYAEEVSSNEDYKKKLVTLLGEKGYKEEVDKQIQLIKNYAAGVEATTEEVLARTGKETINDLTDTEKGEIDIWIQSHNPFLFAKNYGEQTRIVRNGLIINPSMEYNVSVPRANKVKVEMGEAGKLRTVATDESTGYYDERFKIIEGNETLSEFHDILKEFTQMVFETMPPDKRKELSPFSIPAHRKSIVEILFDKNLAFFERISQAVREVYDRFREMFGENPESFSQAHIDPVTGRPDYKVNSAFLKTNRSRISERYNVEILRFKKAMGIALTSQVKKYDKYDITGTPEAIAIIAEALDTIPTLEAIQKRLPGQDLKGLEVGKVLRSGITDQVVKENSLDLPRMMKMYSFLTMEYAARQSVLPAMKMLKDHYEAIKAPNVNKEGGILSNGETPLNNERNKAKTQMESWFNRAVLGNYNSKNELGNTRVKKAITFGMTADEEKESFASKIQATVTGRILNKDEKIMDRKLNELEAELNTIASEGTEEDQAAARAILGNIAKTRKGLGKIMSFKAFMDALFNFIRFRGLGWNLSAYTTNFLEGQTANMIQAASGEYFTPENIYRANDIVKGSWLKTMTWGKHVTDGAKLTRALMDRYRILQDASNELQKATTKTSFSQLKNLDPHEGTRRVEYLNQAPLMIAILMDEKIYSSATPDAKFTFQADINDSYEKIKSGDKVSITRNLMKADVGVGDVVKIKSGKEELYVRIKSVEDLNSVPYERWAQESTYHDEALYQKLKDQDVYSHYGIEVVKIEGEESSVWDAMNPDGTLKEEFRSEENIKNWENADGEKYQTFKSKIAKMIVNTHGDYEDLRGMMATEYMTGKALIMFKRWLARQLYQRFAHRNRGKGQTDIEAGIKDFYGRYYSHTQTSGMLHGSLIGFAGLGILGAGPLGLMIGAGVGLVGANFMGANSDMTFLQELAFTTKELFSSMLRLPLNTITGKNTIKAADYEKLGLSPRDMKNLKANITEMSLLLSVIAMTLFVKGLLYDSDDEEDSPRRQYHNLLVNRLMQLSSQASMYLNPVTNYENFTNMGLMLFLNDVIKTGKEANDFLNGEDILTTGPHAGESALYNQSKKLILPGILKGNFGFENAMERQFQPTPYDSWFKSEEEKAKSAVTRMRAEYRAELEAQGFTQEEAEKLAKDKVPYKEGDQTYQELLEEVEE